MTTDEVRRLLDDHAFVPLWPETGEALHLSRGQTYRGARSGAIRTIRVGPYLRVPTAWLRQMLDMPA
jgi:hypothetical protein